MKRILTVLASLALAACSPSDPPPMAAAPPKKVTAPPAPEKPAPKPPPQEPPPLPPPPKPEAPTPEPTKPEVRKVRRRGSFPLAKGLAGNIHLPAFTFRFLGGWPEVVINGESLGEGNSLWSITDAMEFDPKIRVETWPPDGAEKIGTTSHPENGSAEVWLDQSPGVAQRFPHLQPGETVLYVDGTLGGKKVRGGLRLFVEGCKQVFYTPLVNPDGDEASRYLRTIWFDRKFNE